MSSITKKAVHARRGPQLEPLRVLLPRERGPQRRLKLRRGLPMNSGMRECLLLVALICLLPLAASAQRHETAPLSLETGIGFTSGPTTFLLATELPIRVARYVDLGPMLQLGFGDHRLIVAPTVNARYSFPLSRFVTNESPVWDRLRPMVHGGPGLAYMRNTHRRGDDDELGFLFNVGAGIQYDLTDRVSAGTRMTFNVLPTGVLDDHFFFSWQVAQLRFEF